MHEISLVRNIFRSLEQSFPTEDLPRIRAIKLTVGQLSNVEPLLMQNAFEAVVATDSPQFSQAHLEMEVLPIEIHCEACNARSTIENYKFVCAHCGQPNNNVVQGTELMIGGVEMDD
ncbi:MAG: hydrogenase maturation nickel metallochaperone HypA [Saprospiraceae bacterium]|nr:hydrogenase maturation nickel metallochaperone HypA [Saprospiraceae bacterium]